MSCEEIRKLLLETDSFEDENLSDDIKSHIESCSECRTFLSELRMMKKTLAECAVIPEKNGVALHDALSERIKNGDIQPSIVPAKRRIPFGTIAAAAAVVAIVIVSGTPLKSIFGSMLPKDSAKADKDFAIVADYNAGEGKNATDCEIAAMPEEEKITGNSEKSAKLKIMTESPRENEADVENSIAPTKGLESAKNDNSEKQINTSDSQKVDEDTVTSSATETVTEDSALSDTATAYESPNSGEGGYSSHSITVDKPYESDTVTVYKDDRESPTDGGFTESKFRSAELDDGTAAESTVPENSDASCEEIFTVEGLEPDENSTDVPSNAMLTMTMVPPEGEASDDGNDESTEASEESIASDEEIDSADSGELPSNGGLYMVSGGYIPMSVDEMLLTANDYFAENPCPTPDEHDHNITAEMAETVGEEGFREWFSSITDFEVEYTVSAFNEQFEISEVE